MTLVLIVGLAWALLAVGVAAFFVRVVSIADQPAAPAAWTDEVEGFLRDNLRGALRE